MHHRIYIAKLAATTTRQRCCCVLFNAVKNVRNFLVCGASRGIIYIQNGCLIYTGINITAGFINIYGINRPCRLYGRRKNTSHLKRYRKKSYLSASNKIHCLDSSEVKL